MKKSRVMLFVAAALVAGLALGSVGIASAAGPAAQQGSQQGLGLRLGATMRQAGATMADVVAKLTGRSVAEVRADRVAGRSFADIAKASGVSSDKVVAQTLDARKAQLDSLVKSGKITQAQADAAYARMKDRLSERVTTTAPCGGGQGRGAGGAGCGGACGGRGPNR